MFSVHKLTPDMAEQYVAYFDNRAFSDGNEQRGAIVFDIIGQSIRKPKEVRFQKMNDLSAKETMHMNWSKMGN